MEKQISKLVKIQLFVTRHGQTKQNKSKILCGQKSGKLTQQGIIQAQKIGIHFKNQQFDKIYVSDLGRTRQTFQNILLKAPHLKNIQTKYESLIRQKNGGVLTGQPLNVWQKQATKNKISIRDYKCKDGESWVDVNKRVHAFIQMIVKENILNSKNIIEDQKILVVCHGGYIMEFHNVCKYIASKGNIKPVFSNSARNCSIHVFQLQYPINQGQIQGKQSEYNEDKLSIKCVVDNFTDHMN